MLLVDLALDSKDRAWFDQIIRATNEEVCPGAHIVYEITLDEAKLYWPKGCIIRVVNSKGLSTILPTKEELGFNLEFDKIQGIEWYLIQRL